MHIKRAISDVITAASKMAKILLITGSRQVGKATLLRTEFQEQFSYITFDDIDQLLLAKEDPKLFFKQNPLPLIIDEVQYAPELFSTMKLVVDNVTEKGLLFLSGSQSYHLMKHVSEFLAGRIMIFELPGLSFREMYHIDFHNAFIPCAEYIRIRQKHIQQIHDVWSIIHRGSMPALQDPQIHWEWYYRDYVKTYIERDVRDLVNVKDETVFYKFLVSIAARSGQIIVYNDIANDIGISLKTVQS